MTKTYESNSEPLATVLLATAGLLGAFILLKVATLSVTTADADHVVAGAVRSAMDKPVASPSTEARAVVEGLRKNNLFAPRAQKQYPIHEVIGILGSEALINGRWYKAGDTVAEAKILAIEPTKVKVVWNGQEKEFTPLNSTGGGGPQGPGPGRRGGPPSPPGAPVVVTGGRPGPMGPPGRAMPSAEELNRMRERETNMSPEERQRLREEMRERFGRRGR